MAATCAICQQPISGPQKFVLAGSEVMHPQCARSGLPTALQRTLLEIADANARLASAEREVSVLRQQASVAALRIRSLEASIRDRGDFVETMREQLAAEGAMRRRANEERDAARRAAAAAIADLARARSGAAASAPDGTLPSDVRDDTEIRMSLLDLT